MNQLGGISGAEGKIGNALIANVAVLSLLLNG